MKNISALALGLLITFLVTAYSQIGFASDKYSSACELGTAAKSGEVAFFQHANYKGTCVIRLAGRYSNAKAIGIGNDKISSVKVGAGTQVSLCNDSNFRGQCKVYIKSMASLGKMNDKTSSAIVGKIQKPPPARKPPANTPSANCNPKANQVAFFQHAKYQGTCSVRNMGRYANAKSIGMGNDKISSVKIGHGAQVSLCNDNSFKGRCETYTTSMASLGQMNDKTSSSIVAKKPPPSRTPPAGSSSANCNPNANQAAFFQHANYKGDCVVRNIGRYSSSNEIGIGNDKISSIKLGADIQVGLCKNSSFGGGCSSYKNSASSLGKMNDQTSSAIIEKKSSSNAPFVSCKPNANQAAFFEHTKYKGACVVRDIGRYANAKALGFGNDKISSIEVGSAVQVEICNDSDFRKCEFISTTELLWGRNDKTSSVIIREANNDVDSVAENLPSPGIGASNCSEEKMAEIYAQATVNQKVVLINCSVTLEPRRITRRLIFEGNESTGVTLDCNGATLNGNKGYPNYNKDMIEVRSKKTDANTWVRPQNILIKNCVIIGSIRVWGMGKNGEHPDIKASSKREASNSKHLQRVRNNAPRNIVFDGMTIHGVGRNPFYFSPGVTYSRLVNSEVAGQSIKVGIYLDAESAYNTFENNDIHVDTKEDEWAKKVGYNRGWPQMAIDGSSYNRIINNRFASLRNGGVYLYRNCGEGGTIRHTPPEHNTIENNVFYYKKYTGSNPAIYLGSRDYGRLERATPYNHCDDDDGRPYGSSMSEKDYAKYNTVKNNRFYERKVMNNTSPMTLVDATPEDLIRSKDKSTNSPNYFIDNRMIEE